MREDHEAIWRRKGLRTDGDVVFDGGARQAWGEGPAALQEEGHDLGGRAVGVADAVDVQAQAPHTVAAHVQRPARVAQHEGTGTQTQAEYHIYIIYIYNMREEKAGGEEGGEGRPARAAGHLYYENHCLGECGPTGGG